MRRHSPSLAAGLTLAAAVAAPGHRRAGDRFTLEPPAGGDEVG
jgi:hypothetical protein